MTLNEIIAEYRKDADDSKTPPFASNTQLMADANEAENEACSRGRLLLDSTTAEICELNFTAGDSGLITLDPRIISIKRAMWSGRTTPLLPRLQVRMDEEMPGWESHPTEPQPTFYVTDYQTDAIKLVRTPSENGTVLLSVWRYPLEPMESLDSEPEIKPAYHRGLVQWILFRVYNRQDAELYDAKKAAYAFALFVRQFGEERSARNQAWQRNEMPVFPEPLC